MKVISAVMKKGGAGKTSTIVPLAYLAAQAGAHVALIDMDTTPSAQQWVHGAGLASDHLACDRVSAEELDPLMQQIRASGAIDYVFIDTPPGDKFVIQQAMDASDLVLMPVHNGSGDVAQLVETYHLMRMPLKANPGLKHLIVLNHAGNTPAVVRDTVQGIETALPGARIARTMIPYRSLYLTAKGSRPDAAKWWHYSQLWDEVRAGLA